MIIRNKKRREIEEEGYCTLAQLASLGNENTSFIDKENLQTKLANVRERLDIDPTCVEGRQYYSPAEITRILNRLEKYRLDDDFKVSKESLEKMRAYISGNGNTI